MEGDTDRIGNLPNVIVQHILSFIPTKEAAKTSILSKRWRNQWIFSSNLDFVQGELNKRELFMNFVERVLKLRGSCNIQKFSLSCDVLSDASQVTGWTFAAVRHKVQDLNLRLDKINEALTLPCCIFTCVTLTILKIDMGEYLELPFVINFPSLKILSLAYVTLPDDHSMQRLFSGCPVLKDLTIYNCNWKHVRAVCISCPLLRKLSVSDKGDYNNDDMDDEDDNANNENGNGDQQIDSNGCQVVIIGTSLESFSYEGELRNDYCFYDSSSLKDACILVDGTREERDDVPMEVVYRTHKLLRVLSNIKNLTISVDTLEILTQAEEVLVHLPTFNNLTRLQTDMFATTSVTSKALQSILQNSPCLSSLVFPGAVCIGTHCTEDWKLDPVPPCFLTHLKTIKIGEYYGGDWQLDGIKMLLKYATALETIIIGINFIYEDNTEELAHQLLKLPRPSNCRMFLR